jgi:hypothetical protein
MPHTIAQDHYGTILAQNSFAQKNITTNTLTIVVLLLAINLYEKVVGHIIIDILIGLSFN